MPPSWICIDRYHHGDAKSPHGLRPKTRLWPYNRVNRCIQPRGPAHPIAQTRTFNCMDGAFSSAASQFPPSLPVFPVFPSFSLLLPSLPIPFLRPSRGSGQGPAPPPHPCRLFPYLLPPPRNDVTCRASRCYPWRVTSLRVARNTLTRAS